MSQRKYGKVRLGLMPPLTGLAGIYGTEITHGGRIACDEVNEAGGVLGKPLALLIEDDGSLPESAVAAATKLVDERHCVAIIGNLMSNSRISVAYRVAEPCRIPYLNFSFYEGSILSRYFFHFGALPNQQIDRMIPYMREKFGPRMFFAGNNYEWPRGSIDAAKQALQKAGGTILGEEYTAIGVPVADIDVLLDKVEAAAPDVFVPYFAGSDQLTLLTRFTERGLKSRIAVVMGHYDEVMASKLPPAVREGFYSSNTYFMTVDTKANREYLGRLAALDGVSGVWPHGNGILTNFGEGAYLCVKAFAQAANAAGSLDPEALVEALKTIRVSGPQGVVQMDPVTHHAAVNTYLAHCNADGVFEIVERFGALPPVMPERYSHQHVENRAALGEDIRLQARILEQMSEAVMLVDAREGKIVYANGGAKRMFGYTMDELLGLSIARLNAPHAGDPDATSAAIVETLNRTGTWQGKIQNLRKDGSTLWCFASMSTFTHPVYGEVWMGVHQDISAQEGGEKQLLQSDQRLRFVLDAVNDGVWDWNPATHEDYLSPRWKAILGYRNEELPNLDSTFFGLLHPDDRESMAAALTRHFEHNEPFHLEVRMLHKDGNYRWILSRGEAIRGAAGQPTRMLGTITDITERKRAEEELRRYREYLEEQVAARTRELREANLMLQTVLDTAPLRIFWKDTKLNFLGCNQVFAQDAGMRKPQDLIGKSDYDMVWNATADLYREDDAQVIRTGKSKLSFEEPMDMPDGSRIWLSTNKVPLRNADGETIGVLGTYEPITARKQTEQELLAAKETAERASRAKSEFLSRMSHELRTPMNSILGFTQLLELESLMPEQLEFVHEIHRAGEHLHALINDLLDLSCIEAGKLAMVLQPVNLRAVVADAAKIVQSLVKKMDVTLLNRCDENATVLADPTRLKQLLVNLLSNGAKYNRQGGRIVVACRPVGDDRLRIAVTDTGPGIASEKLSSLFKPFQRLGAEHGTIDGTGIGLALSQNLAELMNGTLSIDSRPGEGSTFWVDLPTPPGHALPAGMTASHRPSSAAPGHTRVLYIEDNVANLRLVEAMLRRRLDLQLLSAANGEFGLELARRFQPDVILLDINLPGMDGYAVFDALKADQNTRDIPVIALSADAMPLDIEQGLKSGFVRYLTKPVTLEELVGTVTAIAKSDKTKSLA